MPIDDFKSATHGTTAGQKLSNLKIFSDCEGTLYDFGTPNVELLDFLYKSAQAGFEVQIVSNDPSGSKLALTMIAFCYEADGDNRLADFIKGFDIAPKSDFSGEKVFLMFDDNHDSHQIDAEHKLAPHDPMMTRMAQYLGFASALPSSRPPTQ
ncbi:MAG: hypothetical protein GW903_07785 [Alphaproteobacteria bacterium]|nr:hypothetical protein [Alphaproteobacteria bacterium]NCQ89163.1 hypothetical protein [Alphaproteobacteria bacterium]NCT08267.1 hypothetical protein [Alphaproteobacteria bacterium]